MVSGPTTAQPVAPNPDAVAPLALNAWLRFDVISRLLPPDVKDVLEVGCGQGAVGARLAQHYNYLGVEPDASSYDVARQRVAAMGSGEVRNISVGELDADARFDMVCAFEVLEHIEDDEAVLRELTGRLRPGGWVLLSVPAHQRRMGAWDELVGHFRRYDPAAMGALLTRCGFEDIEVRQCGAALGFVLEAGRNVVGKRRLAKVSEVSIEERTAGSGRLLQPNGGLKGTAMRYATSPFRMLQRALPNATGTGLVARARLAPAK
jgi:SAM-dependent methyltransferase